ncbi:sugar-binding transcriptional regulator [Rhizobium sp. TRM95111]|uniref:sugar-binding transcriptional regulator n=1 Tax=Rhizobium alarense TaxID=2846851 RepID=UPI001F1B7263|nr:sugar-binding transcriptional regulator [Rhizobium alarense]MCF3638404.1 sugar-binding transcriptional regulator [Rhizobium alarense]
MAKLRRGIHNAYSESASLRLRAAWLYYNQGMTQKDVAEKLGISRSTVIRMLDEAVKRSEVQIWINEGIGDCVELALGVERAYGLDEAIVVPSADSADGTAKSVGLALGQFLTEVIPDDCTIGVGWGRTLTASLASFRPARRERVKVVSLLGGVVEAHHINPIEYTWRLASQLGAECYLFLAPLLVDSRETKRSLIEKCGLRTLFERAENMDIAVVSCGDISATSSSLSRDFIAPDDLRELVAAGCVCDTMCNFLDAEGRTIDHPIRDRVMSIDLDTVKKARHIVLVSGGAHRAAAIRATIRRVGCNTLITDEGAARAMLALAEVKAA